MMCLFLTNTLTRKKERFISLKKGQVSLYVCGITPYDYAHIGHGRCYVTFDVLGRLLKSIGYTVNYVRNFTDIDDKLLEKAKTEFNDETKFIDVAQKFEQAFHEDMNTLNCVSPQHEPTVTDHINDIIAFIEQLIVNGNAYVLDYDVYFDISTFADYGKLSGRSQEELLSGARIEVNERKKNPNDFALWKGNDQKKFWKSPWGYGRPGWHIECSALARRYLGDTIDIHGGGMDLIFPHHENELAQSNSLTHEPLARFWIHNAFVTINKEKMSKSLKNFFTLRDMFEKYDPMVIRLYFLQHHYRSPIDFSLEALDAAKKAYSKLANHFSPFLLSGDNRAFSSLDDYLLPSIYDALTDDLNTPKALGIIFDKLPEIVQSPFVARSVATVLIDVLGLTLEPLAEKTVSLTPEIQSLIDEREKARKEKNWKRADELRDKLREFGIEVQDSKLK